MPTTETAPTPSRHWSSWTLLLLLPLVVALVGKQLAQERGPLWLGENSDPSYQYLLNSLLILDGRAPHHVDHPGTTVQTLGANVLRLAYRDDDPHERVRRIVSNPEEALGLLHGFFLWLTVGATAATGWLVFARTNSLAIAAATQLTPWLELGTFRATLFVDPEALLAPLTILFVGLLVVRARTADDEETARSTMWLNIALGLFAGAGLVTKVTFAPLCLLPLCVQRTWRGAAVTLASTLLGTLVFLAPISSELPRMVRWFGGLATHTGIYGSGGSGFIDPKTYLASVGTLARVDRVLLFIVPASFVVGALATRTADERLRRRGRTLIKTAIVQAIAVLLVAKHPHPRYLVPAAISCAFNVALLVQLARAWPAPKLQPWLRRIGATGATIAVGLAAFDVSRAAGELRAARDVQLEHNRIADQLARDGVRVDYYRSSSVAFALHFGNNAAWHRYGRVLESVYPGRMFFNVFAGVYETFGGIAAEATVFSHGSVYLVGNDLNYFPPQARVPVPPNWEMTLVYRNGSQTVHRLHPR